MSFYTCFDWFKKMRLFSNVRNLKIDVVLKASRSVLIRWFSLNETPLGLSKFISDYFPYFEKINIFFIIIAKKVWITRVTRCVQPDWGYFFMNRTKLRSILKYIEKSLFHRHSKHLFINLPPTAKLINQLLRQIILTNILGKFHKKIKILIFGV